MSTPVGQSEAQPLQARQRSSAWWTSGDRQPSETSEPFTISCSTRARPRVESFSSRVAAYEGHITPPAPVFEARHLPTPVHRCTACTIEPPSCTSRSVCRGSRNRAARRRSASTGRGSTSTPGLSSAPGSKRCLTPANSAITCRGVHPAQQARACPAVAVLAREAAAVGRGQVGGRLHEGPEAGRPGRLAQREVDAHVHAAVAEVPVGHPVQLVGRPAARRTPAGTPPGGPAAPRRPPSRTAPAGRGCGRRARRRPRGSATARSSGTAR